MPLNKQNQTITRPCSVHLFSCFLNKNSSGGVEDGENIKRISIAQIHAITNEDFSEVIWPMENVQGIILKKINIHSLFLFRLGVDILSTPQKLTFLYLCRKCTSIFVCLSTLIYWCRGDMLRILLIIRLCWINLLIFLLRYNTRPYKWGTQWDLNSLVKVC